MFLSGRDGGRVETRGTTNNPFPGQVIFCLVLTDLYGY